MRFQADMIYWAYKLELEGNCVLSAVYSPDEKRILTDEENLMLDVLHKKKIDLSDAIFVVNKNGYIGDATRKEIEYAEKNHKEILYMEKL